MMRLLHKVVKSSQVGKSDGRVDINNKINLSLHLLPQSKEDEIEKAFKLEQEEKQRLAREKAEFEGKVQAEIERRMNFLKGQFEYKHNEILRSAELEKTLMLNEARDMGQSVVAEADAKAIEMRESAIKEGFLEGYEMGTRASISKCESYVKAAAGFLAEINKKKEAYYLSHEDEMQTAVMEMVKKITLSEIQTDKNAIQRIIKQASKPFRNSDYLKISLAGGEVSEKFVSDIKLIKQIIGSVPDIELEILPDAEEGTIVLDNGSEIIDASIPSQLNFLEEIYKQSSSNASKPSSSG